MAVAFQSSFQFTYSTLYDPEVFFYDFSHFIVNNLGATRPGDFDTKDAASSRVNPIHTGECIVQTESRYTAADLCPIERLNKFGPMTNSIIFAASIILSMDTTTIRRSVYLPNVTAYDANCHSASPLCTPKVTIYCVFTSKNESSFTFGCLQHESNSLIGSKIPEAVINCNMQTISTSLCSAGMPASSFQNNLLLERTYGQSFPFEPMYIR